MRERRKIDKQRARQRRGVTAPNTRKPTHTCIFTHTLAFSHTYTHTYTHTYIKGLPLSMAEAQGQASSKAGRGWQVVPQHTHTLHREGEECV